MAFIEPMAIMEAIKISFFTFGYTSPDRNINALPLCYNFGMLVRALGVLTFASLAFGQASLTMTTTGPAYPGATVTINVALAGSTSLNIAGIGLTLPNGSSSPTAGAASTAATKTLWSAGNIVLLVGFTNPAPVANLASTVSNNTYSDGVILAFGYQIPSSAAVGSTISLALASPLGANIAGSAVTLVSPSLTLTVGTNPTCLTLISGHISAYLSAPSIAGLGQIVTELAAAAGTGSCQ